MHWDWHCLVTSRKEALSGPEGPVGPDLNVLGDGEQIMEMCSSFPERNSALGSEVGLLRWSFGLSCTVDFWPLEGALCSYFQGLSLLFF